MRKLHSSDRSLLTASPIACLLAVVVGITSNLHAAISVGPSGIVGPLTFDALPVVSEWSTLSVPGGGATINDPAALEAAVQLLTAGEVTTTLGSSGTVPPSANAIARWNSNLLRLQSRPTGNNYTVLMATLQNDTGANQTALSMSYDFEMQSPADLQIPGFYVYFSLTGAAGSWQPIPSLSGSEAPGTVTASLDLGAFGGWAPGAPLYILWADDNADTATDPSYTIDNISFSTVVVACMITQQPTNTTVGELQTATFRVVATGSPLAFQWFETGVGPVAGANSSALSLPNLSRTSSGRSFYVVITNSVSTCQSDTVTLTVIADETPPYVLCAYGSNDNITIFVPFSEVVTNANNPLNYTVAPVGGGDFLQVVSATHPGGAASGAMVILTVTNTTPMAAGVSYNLFVSSVTDVVGNSIESGGPFPIARFQTTPFLPFNHVWRYEQSGTDLGTDWRGTSYSDGAWPTGAGLLAVEGPGVAPEPINTVLALVPPGGTAQVTTYYFRGHFTFGGNPTGTVLLLRVIIDDGAAFYLNGREIYRQQLAANATNGQFATSHEANHYDGPIYICVSNLVQGDNVLAVEVHQVNDTSTDIVMGAELAALLISLDPIAITQPPASQTVAEGSPVTFTVQVTGTSPRFQWYKGGVEIPGANSASYSISCARSADEGQYSVSVTNDFPSGASSTPATLTVNEDFIAPRIVCAYFGPNVGPSNTIIVVFSEIVTNGIDDVLGYAIQRADGGQPELSAAEGVITAGTNNPCAGPGSGSTVMLVLHESTPREAGIPYNLTTGGIRDMFGNEMAGASVPIAGFPRTVVGLAGQWRYNAATNLGETWKPRLFNDSGWALGTAVFDGKIDTNQVSGYTNRATIGGIPVNTHISISNQTGTAALSAIYFRTHFNYGGSLGTQVLCIRQLIDDGAVYYLNGTEVHRIRMAPGVVANGTFASATEGDADLEGPTYICVTNLLAGDNVLAVEVHQVNLGSSDITFGPEVVVLQTTPPASLTISQSGGMVTLTWSGPAGSILQEALSLTGSWGTSGNQSQNQTFAAGGPMRFFRVRE